jgi:serine/threonine protein kinase
MLFGKTPFFGMTINELKKDILLQLKDFKFPREISQESKDLILRLLKTNPKERIDWYDFFNHSLFKRHSVSNNLGDLYSHIGNMLMQP